MRCRVTTVAQSGLVRPGRRQWFAFFYNVDGKHLCVAVPDLYFVYSAREDVPGFARADGLVRLAPLQDGKPTVQQIRGVETGVGMQTRIYVGSHLHKHHHRFVAAIGHVEPFHDGSRDWFWHLIPPTETGAAREGTAPLQ